MKQDNRKTVKVEAEMRTKEISKMIDEGGLGADKYYKIKKESPSPSTDQGDKQTKKDA